MLIRYILVRSSDRIGTDPEILDADIFGSDIRPSLEDYDIFGYIFWISENFLKDFHYSQKKCQRGLAQL